MGGADFYYFPEDRKKDWEEAINSSSSLSSIFSNIGGISDKAVTLKDKAETYLVTLERQDELFELALDIIKKKLGELAINSAAIVKNATAIDARRPELLEYLTDAESLVAFKGNPLRERPLVVSTSSSTYSTSQQDTKFGMIYGNRAETLSALLLFPARVHNVFLEALANIIIYLNDDIISLLNNNSAKLIFKDQLNSYAQAYAYTMTALPLRDGFYIKQTQGEYKTLMTTFWLDFINEIYTVRDTASLEMLFKPSGDCPHLITMGAGTRASHDPTFGYLAAHIWRAYKLGATTGALLSLFNTRCTPATDDKRAARPDKAFDSAVVRGVTLGNLFTHMEPKVLEFLLHLWYLIRKAAATMTTAAPAPPTTPETLPA